MKTYVIAGNYDQYVNWCREYRVSPSSPLVCYIAERDGERTLAGIRNPEIVCVGTYRDRRDFRELEMLIRDRNRPMEPKVVYIEVPAKPVPKPRVSFVQVGSRICNWQ